MQIELICLTKTFACRHILLFDINLDCSAAGEGEQFSNCGKMGKVSLIPLLANIQLN